MHKEWLRMFEQISEAIRFIPSDDRNVRLRVAASVFAALGHDGQGIFMSWVDGVSTAQKNKSMWKWASKASKLSTSTVFFLARQHGYTGNSNISRDLSQKIAKAKQDRLSIRDVSEAKMRAEIVQTAKQIYTSYPLVDKDVGHPYLAKKKIPASLANYLGIRVFAGNLLIPAHDVSNGEIVDWQVIRPDGFKLFTKGGTGANGKYNKIVGSRSTVAVCEGWATGAAHFMLTGETTIVSFNDHNSLQNVIHYSKMRSGSSDSFRLIYVADNDASRAGQRIAEKIAAHVDSVVMSSITGEDRNDQAIRSGLI
jgi:phage/plasmid primase-like uncharacterized protein